MIAESFNSNTKNTIKDKATKYMPATIPTAK